MLGLLIGFGLKLSIRSDALYEQNIELKKQNESMLARIATLEQAAKLTATIEGEAESSREDVVDQLQRLAASHERLRQDIKTRPTQIQIAGIPAMQGKLSAIDATIDEKSAALDRRLKAIELRLRMGRTP